MTKRKKNDKVKITGLIFILLGFFIMFFLLKWINTTDLLTFRRPFQWIGPISLFVGCILHFKLFNIKKIVKMMFLPLIITALGTVLYTYHQLFSPNFNRDTKIIIFIYLSALYILFLKGKEQLENDK